MKQIVPSKEILMCDICHREANHLTTCIFCGTEYCFMCESIIPGCLHKVNTCKKCDDHPVLLEIVYRHVPFISAALIEREREIRAASIAYPAPEQIKAEQ